MRIVTNILAPTSDPHPQVMTPTTHVLKPLLPSMTRKVNIDTFSEVGLVSHSFLPELMSGQQFNTFVYLCTGPQEHQHWEAQ
jgi:hypothetical protein